MQSVSVEVTDSSSCRQRGLGHPNDSLFTEALIQSDGLNISSDA